MNVYVFQEPSRIEIHAQTEEEAWSKLREVFGPFTEYELIDVREDD